METNYVYTYTLYSNNLWDGSRSFAPDIKLDDFGRGVWTDILKAHKIIYINPKGQSIILKDKNGKK